LDEEIVDLANDLHELFEADGFGDVGVGVQSLAAQNVFLGGRGGEHNDVDVTQVRIRFDLFEQLVAVVFRQIQVEQDQIRLWRALMRTEILSRPVDRGVSGDLRFG
jgi:hypothetical protein